MLYALNPEIGSFKSNLKLNMKDKIYSDHLFKFFLLQINKSICVFFKISYTFNMSSFLCSPSPSKVIT